MGSAFNHNLKMDGKGEGKTADIHSEPYQVLCWIQSVIHRILKKKNQQTIIAHQY